MKAMIISFVCVLTFATQSLSAQNLTLEVRGIKMWLVNSMSPSTTLRRHS